MANPGRDQSNFHFSDGDPGFAVDFQTSMNNGFTRSIVPEISLDQWFSRPVKIASINWVEGTKLETSLKPWELYLTDDVVKRKLENYSMLRCNLRVKVTISASPFYYSLAMVSYRPLTNYGPLEYQHVGANPARLCLRSQRPKIFVTPQDGMGGEISLPFFYPDPWLQNNSVFFSDMGDLSIDSFENLENCNGVTGGDITINIYAWAENMELTGATVQLQGRKSKVGYKKKNRNPKADVMAKVKDFGLKEDEYGDGPVSGIASAVAQAGGALASVPIIGPFARATQIGAGTVSRIASWFGFTNVPIIEDAKPFKDLPFAGFASSEISAPTPKLTLDPKNELTIDSRTVGLDGTDELSLSSFVTREAWITSAVWSETDAPNTRIFTSFVCPSMLYAKMSSEGSTIYPTPMSHACSMYQFWSGTVVFRFKIVCSQYHRGRIKIAYEPNQNATIGVDEPTDTTNETRVYDIATTTDVEICVPWMSNEAYKPNWSMDSSGAANTLPYGPGDGFGLVGNTYSNGFLTVSVANELTSPVASAPVSIQVFVRAGEDFELMGPRNPSNNVQWKVQSKTTPNMAPEDAPICDMMGDTEADLSDVNLVFGGETAKSLRQLLHRHCYVRSAYIEGLGKNMVYRNLQSMYPLSLDCNTSADNIHAGVTGTFNFCSNTFVSWISPCFSGRRGSMYWAMNPAGTQSGDIKATFSRIGDTSRTAISPATYDSFTTAGSASNFGMSRMGISSEETLTSGAGKAMYNTKTQSGTTALIPYISNKKFGKTRQKPWTAGAILYPDDAETFMTTAYMPFDSQNMSMEYYCAAGPDFNLFFFTGVPAIQSRGSLPT